MGLMLLTITDLYLQVCRKSTPRKKILKNPNFRYRCKLELDNLLRLPGFAFFYIFLNHLNFLKLYYDLF